LLDRVYSCECFFFQAEDGIRDRNVTGVQTCALPIFRGGGPASRESELLRPVAAADKIHAVLLSGGSAFGLDAAGGVMRWLAEHEIGRASCRERVGVSEARD